MAEDDRTYSPSQAEANRARTQGLGVGQKDMDQERDPKRDAWLGEGVPPNVAVHDTGDADNPQNDWGEAVDEGAVRGVNHTRRPERTEALRGQGAKTRKLNKDIVSRRS